MVKVGNTETHNYVSITSSRCVLVVIDGFRCVFISKCSCWCAFVCRWMQKGREVGAVNNWDSWTSSRFVLTWILTHAEEKNGFFFSFMCLNASHSFYMIHFEKKNCTRLQAIGKCVILAAKNFDAAFNIFKESFTEWQWIDGIFFLKKPFLDIFEILIDWWS